MRLDREQQKRAGRSPERRSCLPSQSASFSPANEEDAMRHAIRTEAWIVCAQIDAGELPALDEGPNLMARFEREYE